MLKKIIGPLLFLGCAITVFAADAYTDLFNRTTAKLDKGGLYFHYQNLENLPEQVQSLMDFVEKSAPENDPVKQLAIKNMVDFFKAIDFSELQAFGASNKKLAKDLYVTKVFVSVDKKVDGMLFAGVGKKNQPLFNIGNVLPANTLFATAFLIDGQNAFRKCEEKFSANAEFQSVVKMFQQMSGVAIKDFAANCSGEFFIGVFKGAAAGEVDFFAVIPDRMNVLKNMATLYLGQQMVKSPDGASVFEMPSSFPNVKGNIKFIFNKNVLTVCNNVNVLNNASAAKLSDVNPGVFGFLKKVQGIAFAVVNFNPADFFDGADPFIYQVGGSSFADKGGFYIEEKTNFNTAAWKSYAPFIKLIQSKFEMPEVPGE